MFAFNNFLDKPVNSSPEQCSITMAVYICLFAVLSVNVNKLMLFLVFVVSERVFSECFSDNSATTCLFKMKENEMTPRFVAGKQDSGYLLTGTNGMGELKVDAESLRSKNI